MATCIIIVLVCSIAYCITEDKAKSGMNSGAFGRAVAKITEEILKGLFR